MTRDEKRIHNDTIRLIFNLVLLMSAYPEEVIKDTLVSREYNKHNRMVKSETYKARFVWEDQFRKIYPDRESIPTGKHVRGHMVRGHWRRQPYGHGRVMRYTKWIMPFLKTGSGLGVLSDCH